MNRVNDISQVLRQWQLLAALSSRPGGGTVAEFAAEHAVDQKTIRRDLLDLRKAGFAVEESLGDHGRKHWTLAPLPSLASLSLNWQEAISLYLGRRFMAPLNGTHFGLSASRAFGKIRATLGENAVRYLDKMSRAFHITGTGQVDYSEKAEIVDALTRAIEERRIVQLVYRSERATEPASRDVHPLCWVFHNCSAYLVANSPDHGECREYKLDRMESAHVIDLKFTMPADFSMSEYLAGALGVYRGNGDGKPTTVRARFHASVARFVQEKRWHASQTLTPQPDGSLIATYRLTSLVEIKSWLLSWGRRVEVLEPHALVAALREEAAALHEMYSNQLLPLGSGGQGGSGQPVLPPPIGSKPRRDRPSRGVGFQPASGRTAQSTTRPAKPRKPRPK